jgi:hypothetical protein
MNVRHLRNFAVFGVVLFVSAACQKGNPARPSMASAVEELAQGGSVLLTGLSGNYVGLAKEICEGASEDIVIHDLKVDYRVHGGASLDGALLVACDAGNCASGTPLGTVTDCPVVPPNPCEAGLPKAISEGSAPACLTGDPEGTGSVRVYGGKPPDASDTWTVVAYFEGTGDASNAVSGAVERPGTVVAPDWSESSTRFARRHLRLGVK